MLTPVGQVSITSVTPVALAQISAADARCAGYESREALLAELQSRVEGEIYRIELGPLRSDPRLALRETQLSTDAESKDLQKRLRRLDTLGGDEAWTLRTLAVIRSHPGVRAGDLCSMVGQEKARFKLNVRKLKNLGLTESLETGYRLSPRGEALFSALRSSRSGDDI